MNYSYGNEETEKKLENLRWYEEIKVSVKDKDYAAEKVVEKPEMKENTLVKNHFIKAKPNIFKACILVLLHPRT